MRKNVRFTVDMTGILQGVGFRPTMARIADEDGLGGSVKNRSGTVRLVVEGARSAVERFIKTLPERLPVQARLEFLEVVSREEIAHASKGFEILESTADDAMRISIPADLVMCDDCRAEVLDPDSRYYLYPFTTCTNCGPRYTVVDQMPYDRERTALKAFPLCADCNAEYTAPLNRRFHAESIACPKCGPSLFCLDADGLDVKTDNPLEMARQFLSEGKLVAVRGLGGFLIAFDAFNELAIKTLRQRKRRPDKPLAVMARNLDVLKEHCIISSEQEQLLTSCAAPIVILDALPQSSLPFYLLSPGGDNLGAMLPTTPLHMLLSESMDVLVMTSGNRGGEPICITNDDAVERLTGIVDLFLCHDRGINLRNDDSLSVCVDGAPQVWRRARGYAPEAIFLKTPLKKTVLATGAELKNTVALGFDNEVVLSPHIGDLETPEAIDGMKQVVDRFPRFFNKAPQVIAVDLHPDMHSTQIGRKLAKQLSVPVVEVQHHHAHAAACMAEHELADSLALVFDGTGMGTDGSIWGAELLHVTPGSFERYATFMPAGLIGLDAAVAQPARQLVARWLQAGVSITPEWKDRLGLTEQEISVWPMQLAKKINTADTHAAGRLFDAFSALIGTTPGRITYEGQAAIAMETAARKASEQDLVELPFDVKQDGNLMLVDWSELFTRFEQPPGDEMTCALALSFHKAVADAAVCMTEHGRQLTGCGRVVLSGGVMMNRILTTRVIELLRNKGFEVFLHRAVPPNDGAIALGQAVIAGGIK